MSIERISVVILALIAVVMGANYVSATSRFYDANKAYDALALSLVSFEYSGVTEPVPVEINIENPSSNSIDILALRLTLRAGLQNVGSGEIYIDEQLFSGATQTYLVPARILDQNVMLRLEDDEIRWLIRGEVQVRIDADMEPVWIQFSVRTVSP